MILQTTSDLITEHQAVTLRSGEVGHQAQLINDRVLVISKTQIALYQYKDAFLDPLGNGFIRSEALPEQSWLQESPFITSHKAGFVGLSNGYVFLIGLNDIRLYPSPETALRGEQELVRMSLAG